MHRRATWLAAAARARRKMPENQGVESDDAGDRRLGETVRLLRQRAGFSIQDVANRTGLSTGMISQLERARATPSVRTLRLLSVALDVPISYFFEPRAIPEQPQRYIVRKNDRRLLRLTASGVVKEALSPAEKGEVELYELTLNPDGSSGTDSISTPVKKPATYSPEACVCGLITKRIFWRRATASASRVPSRTCSIIRRNRSRASSGW